MNRVIPPLKQNAAGTSARVLNFTVSINKFFDTFIASGNSISLFTANFGFQYFLIFIFFSSLQIKFSEYLINLYLYKKTRYF